MSKTSRRVGAGVWLPAVFFVVAFVTVPWVQATTIIWGNTATPFGTNSSWSGGPAPGASDIGSFQAATATFNPNLTASRSISGLEFTSGTAAWTFTATAGPPLKTLTLGSAGILSNDDSTQTFNNANLGLVLGANASFISNSSGALSFGSGLSAFSQGMFTLTLDGSSTNSANAIGKNITGSGALIKSGAGTWTLSGSNTRTGAVTVNAGTLIVSGANIYTSATTVNGGTLKAGVASVANTSGAFGNNSAVTLANVAGATVDITGFNTQIGSLTGGGVTGGNVTLGAATLTVGGDNTSPGAFAGIISGAGGGLTKIGTGTLTLSGTNTYTGATTINAGTLSVATIGNGGVAGNLGQASNAAANLTLGGGTLQYTGATASTDRNFVLTTGTTSTIDVNANILTMAGASTATTGALTKAGAGTLVLSGANLYTGATTVSAGTLKAGVASVANTSGAFGNNSAVTLANVAGATLDIAGFNTQIGSLTGGGGTGGNVTLGAATLTVGGDNTSPGAFAGIISGSGGGLTKIGTGTLTLSGANTFTGSIAVNGGKLRVSSDGNFGNTANDPTLNGGTLETSAGFTLNSNRVVTVGASGGTIDVDASQTFTLGTAGQLTGSGALTKADAGTLAISAANTGYTGNIALNGGVTRLGSYDSLGSGTASTLTINSGAELEADWGAATNYQGNIVINNGIIRHTDTNGTKAGFQNNVGTVTTLTVNGTAQIIDQDGAGSGGFISLDGIVQLNTGANVTTNAVNANDEVRFGGAQNITFAAGSSLATTGAGTVSFGSGSARTIIAQGTSASQATLTLGAATNFANPGTKFQIDGSGTGGLRVEGTKAKVDTLMTDARLAATTGSGGTLTVAYTDNGSRTLSNSANLSAPSTVALGLESNGGTFTLGTLGGGTGDLDNWGGLVVGPNTTVTFAENYVFDLTADLTLLGGTLKLNGTTQTFDTLTVSANSTIDFSGGSSVLNLTSLNIASGVTLSIINWSNAADYFYTTNWTGATFDTTGAHPMDQVVFNSPTYDGNDTKWLSYGGHQITPVPEPSTYGAVLLATTTGLVYWRRRRATKRAA